MIGRRSSTASVSGKARTNGGGIARAITTDYERGQKIMMMFHKTSLDPTFSAFQSRTILNHRKRKKIMISRYNLANYNFNIWYLYAYVKSIRYSILSIISVRLSISTWLISRQILHLCVNMYARIMYIYTYVVCTHITQTHTHIYTYPLIGK